MITFTKEWQNQLSAGYQGCTITEFVFIADIEITNDQLLESFISSTSYTFDSLDWVKKIALPKSNYLRQAFDPDLFSINDFRVFNKMDAYKYLKSFLDDWETEDKDDFRKVLKQFEEIFYKIETDCFYIIDKEWFENGDPKVREPENWIYIYYFLVIWIDRKENKLFISEWYYD